MPFRRILLRILLWSLGVAAVVGAMAILMGGAEVGWRVAATALITSGAALLMMPASLLVENPKAQRAGTLALTIIIVEFLLAMLLLWGEPLASWRFSEIVGLSMLFLAMCGLPAIALLRIASSPQARIAGYSGVIISAVVLALLEIAVLMRGHDGRVYASAAALGTLGILGVAALAGIEKPAGRWWRAIGVFLSAMSIAVALFAIWKDIHHGSGEFAVLVCAAAVIAHANLCLLAPLTGGQRWVRIATIAASIATAGFISLMALVEGHGGDLPIYQFPGATGLVAGCGSLALLVLARINRNIDRVAVLSEIRSITVICPACQKKQTLPTGGGACANCGLKIDVRIEEPRCPKCDYVLLMLKSDRCPECGTVVRGAAV